MNVAILKQQNTQLIKALAQQEQQLSAQEKQLLSKQKRITQLEELIHSLNQKQFGVSSEQSPHQAQLFDEAEEYQDHNREEKDNDDDTVIVIVPAHTRQKQRRVSIPVDIPREDIIYDLSDEQKICPHDGAELKQIGEETHEQLDIVPAKVTCLRHIRLKYACPCCDKHLITAWLISA